MNSIHLLHASRRAALVAALVGLLIAPSAAFAATGQITVSGGTWTGKVDGVTKYTGNNMAAAANACVAAMSSGTLNILNSGTLTGPINLKSNVRVNGTGKTITSSGQTGMIYAQNSSSTGASDVIMAGTNWYGMFFRTCQGTSFSNVRGTANLAYRIDNCKGGNGSNFSFGTITIGTGGSHAVETYGINGVSWGTLTTSDRSGGCGMLLNFSSNASGTSVNATRCNPSGGYAGFRTANTNGRTTLGSVTATTCGRGYFSVSSSRDCTISTVNITNTTSHGVWLQTTANTRVNGGTVRNGHPCTSISSDLGGNSINVTCL